MKRKTEPLFCGLSDIEMGIDCFDLGRGITLRKTYAHLMAPFIVAFHPAPEGEHHPGPWKASSGGFGFDVLAELFVPDDLDEDLGPALQVARSITSTIRLGVTPAISIPVISSHSFGLLANIPDAEAQIAPYEVLPRYFELATENETLNEKSLNWVKEYWPTLHRLKSSSAEFAIAVGAIDAGQYLKQTALTMVSLWAALEALFSPAQSELRFRVSASIAAYLEPPGEARLERQKSVAKLYDKRSAAAHGKPKHSANELATTFNLLRDALLKMLENGEVPTRESLERDLFGNGG